MGPDEQDHEFSRRGTIRAIGRGLAVLQAVNRAGSLSMMDIAVSSGVPYPTACRIVQTLIVEGMIEREPDRKRYRATALVQTLSAGYQSESHLVSTARPYIVDLTNRLRWPISVTTRVGTSMMVRDSTHSLTPLAFYVYPPGYTLPMLESSSGRAYLAFCPEDERDSLLQVIGSARGGAEVALARRTDIMRLFEQIREGGFATHQRTRATENPGKTSSISAPVFFRGRVTGTLTLIFFASAMPMEEAVKQFANPLKDASTSLSAELGSA
jgi:IclR family mhp operon transcriptional activator